VLGGVRWICSPRDFVGMLHLIERFSKLDTHFYTGLAGTLFMAGCAKIGLHM